MKGEKRKEGRKEVKEGGRQPKGIGKETRINKGQKTTQNYCAQGSDVCQHSCHLSIWNATISFTFLSNLCKNKCRSSYDLPSIIPAWLTLHLASKTS